MTIVVLLATPPRATTHAPRFMNDEGHWLDHFKLAWQTAVTNGFDDLKELL